MRVRGTTLDVPVWILLSIGAAVLSLGVSRLAVEESWGACARDAYLVVLVVWVGSAIDGAHKAVSELLETRRQAAKD